MDTLKMWSSSISEELEQSRKLYSLLSFVSYQLLVLTEVQNGLTKRNSFGRFY